MREAAHGTNSQLMDVYHRTKAEIDAVHAMEGLSLQEKEARIREIKRKAAMETSQIMSRARSALNKQLRSLRDMDSKARESQILLARAKQLASGQMGTPTSTTLQKVTGVRPCWSR